MPISDTLKAKFKYLKSKEGKSDTIARNKFFSQSNYGSDSMLGILRQDMRDNDIDINQYLTNIFTLKSTTGRNTKYVDEIDAAKTEKAIMKTVDTLDKLRNFKSEVESYMKSLNHDETVAIEKLKNLIGKKPTSATGTGHGIAGYIYNQMKGDNVDLKKLEEFKKQFKDIKQYIELHKKWKELQDNVSQLDNKVNTITSPNITEIRDKIVLLYQSVAYYDISKKSTQNNREISEAYERYNQEYEDLKTQYNNNFGYIEKMRDDKMKLLEETLAKFNGLLGIEQSDIDKLKEDANVNNTNESVEDFQKKLAFTKYATNSTNIKTKIEEIRKGLREIQKKGAKLWKDLSNDVERIIENTENDVNKSPRDMKNSELEKSVEDLKTRYGKYKKMAVQS